MVDLEDQLRRYADRVEALHGPADTPARVVTALPPAPSNRHRLPLLAAVAVALITIGVISTLVFQREMTRIDTVSDDSKDIGREQTLEPPRLLPSATWTLVGVEEFPPGGNPSPAAVITFRYEDSLFVLVTQDHEGPALPREQAEPSASYNRVSLQWSAAGTSFLLTAFDVPAATVTDAAALIEPNGDSWTVPGAVLAQGQTTASSASERADFAPTDAPTSQPDLTQTIEQHVRRANPADFYLMLASASSLGTTIEFDIAGAPGYVIIDGEVGYALRFADGHLTTWQPQTPVPVDLRPFLASLQPVDQVTWQSAVEAWLDDLTPLGPPSNVASERLSFSSRIVSDEARGGAALVRTQVENAPEDSQTFEIVVNGEVRGGGSYRPGVVAGVPLRDEEEAHVEVRVYGPNGDLLATTSLEEPLLVDG